MRRFPILLALLAVVAPALEARELHWRELAVRAELDAEGRLLVQERHTMVFDGDWNGGERTFRVEPGQKLDFHSIDRVDPERGPVALRRGDLDELDRWDWSSRHVLRWRSRLPSDPPFDDTELAYVLTYALSDILVPRDGGYLLDHDFAFTDRVGVIERFVLELELAPEWRTSEPLEGSVVLTDLYPGIGAPVTVQLEHAEDRPLLGVTRPLGAEWRHAGLAAALAGMAAMLLPFLRRERALGRFEPTDAPAAPSPAWIEQHALSWLPEQVGALWDEKIGPPEVAAVIARLVGEGKLASSVERKGRFFKRQVLTLELLVDRGELKGYEKKLVRKLFFGGRDRVSTDELRKHYKTKGFDPAATIRPELERSIEKRSPSTGGPEKPSYRRTLYLFAAGAACGITALVMRPEPTLQWGLLAGAAWFVLFWLGFWAARRWRRHVAGLHARLLWIVLPAALLALAYWLLPTIFLGRYAAVAPRHLGLLALALIVLASFSSLLNQAATRVPIERLRLRRRLHTVREWWKAELHRESPALSDSLLPYLIAIGLQRRVDRWFQRFGRSVTASHLDTSIPPEAIHGARWTGGGGTFGGAGATSAWTAAATGMAAGVAAASSGGSGGGGGGGSSSGGGGGGGW
jgi:hypothetical protein